MRPRTVVLAATSSIMLIFMLISTVPLIRAAGVPIVEPGTSPGDSAALAIQVFEKPADSKYGMVMNGTLGVNAAYRFFVKEPTDLLKLPLLGYSNASLTFENSTQVPQQPNQSVPLIAYLANITCPANPSRTNITYGQPVSIGLAVNISDATLYYNYSQDDLTPEKNGTYHLAFWTFTPVTFIKLPDQARIDRYSEETCAVTTQNDRSSRVTFYDIVFSMQNSTDTGPDHKPAVLPLPSAHPQPDQIIPVGKSKEITITNADSSIGETTHKALMTVNNVTFYKKQHPTETISEKPGFGTIYFNYTIKSTDNTAFYGHVGIEAVAEGKRYPYQLVSGAMGELLIPGESRDSWIAIQIPKDSQEVLFDITDLRTNNLQWRVPIDLQE